MDNYNGLKDFFVQFPKFVDNPLYITGESYAGIYVPTLAVRIVEGMSGFKLNLQVCRMRRAGLELATPPPPARLQFSRLVPDRLLNSRLALQGIAVGNGMLSSDLNVDTLMQFTYAHGMIDQNTWEVLETSCCKGCADTCSFHDAASAFCEETINKVVQDTWSLGLNVYDLYRDCYHPQSSIGHHPRFLHDLCSAFPRFSPLIHLLHKVGTGGTSKAISRVNSSLLLTNARAHVSNSFSPLQQFEHHKNQTDPLRVATNDPPCLDSRGVTTYLNRQDVRKALYIPSFVGEWTVCRC
jgi:cathepsin A (carboxypeptidase C)